MDNLFLVIGELSAAFRFCVYYERDTEPTGYKVVVARTGMTWSEAQAFCEGLAARPELGIAPSEDWDNSYPVR